MPMAYVVEYAVIIATCLQREYYLLEFHIPVFDERRLFCKYIILCYLLLCKLERCTCLKTELNRLGYRSVSEKTILLITYSSQSARENCL